ncbi:hypothetical protein OHC33_005737 [Knufia fluminis]|uniref:BTB domain-containing protein n=1 Tax=Knufia fluminis TaxID=191047 RepID=A0AAN8EDN4_9EURO|nr:hypothetical protein OHC33_005737 [Knufia fluminis]
MAPTFNTRYRDPKPTTDHSTATDKPRLLEGELIKVTVHDDNQCLEMHLHKTLLRYRSPYFAALDNFKEGAYNAVELEDMDVEAFRYVLHWMYTDNLPSEQCVDTDDLLAKAYVVADRLLMRKCKNMIMDSIRESFKHVAGSKSLATGFEAVESLGYPASSQLARFFIHEIQHEFVKGTGADREEWILKMVENVRGDPISSMFCEVALSILCAQTTTNRKSDSVQLPYDDVGTYPSGRGGCIYHDHEEGEECYLTKG